MNILFLTRSFPTPDNPQRGIYVYHRLRYLEEWGHNVFVVMPTRKRHGLRLGPDQKGYFMEIGHSKQIWVDVANYIDFPFILATLGLHPFLKRFSILHEIDLVVVHSQQNGWGAYLLKKSLGIPYVVISHGSDIHTAPQRNLRSYREARRILESADRVVFVSRFLQQTAEKIGLRSRNTVIPNGVDWVLSHPRSQKSTVLHIGFVGGLIPIKRAEFLPEIFREVKQRVPSAFLTIVGEGPERKTIEQKMKKYDLTSSVELKGRLDHDSTLEAISQLDILILPSRNEGMGIVIIEAQMMGVPVVASANGGIPETVGRGGTIVEDGNHWVERFAEAIVDVYQNPPSSAVLQHNASQYLWNQTVKREEELYKEVLLEKR